MLVDALQVKVADATSITLGDKDGNVKNVRAKVGTAIVLSAMLKAGDQTAYAKTPFEWVIEGGALPSTESHDSSVSFMPMSAGTSTVTVKFGSLAAQLPVAVDAVN